MRQTSPALSETLLYQYISYVKLQVWLNKNLQSSLFEKIMVKQVRGMPE